MEWHQRILFFFLPRLPGFIVSQVVVPSKTECAHKNLKIILNVAVATLQMFFTLNFLWFQSLASSRHPSSERKQRMRHSKQPTTTYTFTGQNASDFSFFNFGKSNKLVLIGVNCSLNVLHEQTHADNILPFQRQIMRFIHFRQPLKEPHVQLRVNKSGAQLLL